MYDVTVERIERFLEALKVPRQAVPDNDLVLAGLPGRDGLYSVFFSVDSKRDTLILVAPGLLSVPPARQREVAFATAVINDRILLGRFGLDPSDGELRFEVALPHRNRGLSDEQIMHAIGALIETLDQEMPRLQRLRWTDDSAEEVLELLEETAVQRMLAALPDLPSEQETA